MPIRKPVFFQRSLLAVAVISLSACSTTPRLPDYDLSRIGDGIVNAGKSTADFSRRAWNRTTYLLGFSDGEGAADERQLLDDVDLALLETDADMVVSPITRPVVQEQATAYNPDNADNQTGIATAYDQQLAGVTEAPLTSGGITKEIIHEVAPNENLWKIAKMTTGNATNWHVLADVNNLAPDAAVFPGQELIIPADMVKAEYLQQAGSSIQMDELNQDDTLQTALLGENRTELATAAPERLKIPAADSAETRTINDPQPINGTAFKLQPAETLWDLAKRTTGDAMNWKAIAQLNNFSDKQAVVVHAGQTIYVPDDLVDEQESAPTDQSTADISETLKPVTQEKLALLETNTDASGDQLGKQSSVQFAASSSASSSDLDVIATGKLIAETTGAVQALPTTELPAISPLDETQSIKLSDAAEINAAPVVAPEQSTQAQPTQAQPMKIVEATYKADELLEPLPIDDELPTIGKNSRATPDEIMVSGTYYPKAVYNEADFSSSLLMRVSPGTKLQVSNAIGTWFQVETDKGIGYVHQRDIK